MCFGFFRRMLKIFGVNVAKIDLDISMLHMLILPSQRLMMLFSNVADVIFKCCGILSSCYTQQDLCCDVRAIAKLGTNNLLRIHGVCYLVLSDCVLAAEQNKLRPHVTKNSKRQLVSDFVTKSGVPTFRASDPRVAPKSEPPPRAPSQRPPPPSST
jgi:hypothetical protein